MRRRSIKRHGRAKFHRIPILTKESLRNGKSRTAAGGRVSAISGDSAFLLAVEKRRSTEFVEPVG